MRHPQPWRRSRDIPRNLRHTRDRQPGTPRPPRNDNLFPAELLKRTGQADGLVSSVSSECRAKVLDSRAASPSFGVSTSIIPKSRSRISCVAGAGLRIVSKPACFARANRGRPFQAVIRGRSETRSPKQVLAPGCGRCQPGSNAFAPGATLMRFCPPSSTGIDAHA